MTNVGYQTLTLPASSSTTSSNGAVIVINLPVTTIETLMLDTALAVDRVTSFLRMDLGSFKDMRGNNVTAIANGYALPASSYTADTTAPTLTGFVLDMNSGSFKLSFTEYVRIQDVSVTGMRIQNSTYGNNVGHNLILGTALKQTVNNTKEVELVFSATELNAIKYYDNLATNRNSSYIKFAVDTVKDMGHNGNVAMENSAAFRATQYIPDTTPPALTSFNLDLDSGLMTLEFSESVDGTTFDQASVKLHSMAAKQYSQVHDMIGPSLVAGTLSASNNLYLTLGSADLAR